MNIKAKENEEKKNENCSNRIEKEDKWSKGV